jgi:anthranilate phosphoribosyltransferase
LALVRSVLDNEPGPARDIVALNAGVALYAADVASSMADGIRLAQEAIGSGRAAAKLSQFVAVSQRLARP